MIDRAMLRKPVEDHLTSFSDDPQREFLLDKSPRVTLQPGVTYRYLDVTRDFASGSQMALTTSQVQPPRPEQV